MNKYTAIIVGLVNLLCFQLVFLSTFTDISLAGTIPDLLLPIFLGVAAIVSIGRVRFVRDRLVRCLAILACLPGLAISTILPGFLLLIILGGGMLGVFMALPLILFESQLQSLESPSGRFIASVDMRFALSIDAERGLAQVRVRPRNFPLIEREVAAFPSFQYDSDEFVSWLPDDTLFVHETGEVINPIGVRLRMPYWLELALLFLRPPP
jgi:hypothetical protein